MVYQKYLDLLVAINGENEFEETLQKYPKSLENILPDHSVVSQMGLDKDQVRSAIIHIQENKELYHLVMENQGLLSLLKDGSWSEGLTEVYLKNKDLIHSRQWFNNWFLESLAAQYEGAYRTPGMTSVKLVSDLSTMRESMPPTQQKLLLTGVGKKIEDYLAKLQLNELSKFPVSNHYLQILDKISGEDWVHLKSKYTSALQKLVSQHLPRALKKEIQDQNDLEKIEKAARIAGDYLTNKNLLSVADEIKHVQQSNPINHIEKKSFPWIYWIIGIIAMSTLLFIYQQVSLDESYQDRYNSYKEKRNEFLENRRLSQENLELRKKVTITGNELYGQKNGLPLFYTYIQTNKFLDLNEIDNEMYNFLKIINADSFDVSTIYINGIFYTTQRDKPYRTVLAEYSNLQNKPDYKVVTNPRSTKSLLPPGHPQDRYTLNVQRIDNYESGVIETYVYDIEIDLLEDSVVIYDYIPMPEVSLRLSMSSFLNEILKENDEDQKMEELGTSWRLYHLMDSVRLQYRGPLQRKGINYNADHSDISATFNWELTMDDDLAFVRIRSEEIGGYYLMDRNFGTVKQVKTSFPTKNRINTEYLIQLVP